MRKYQVLFLLITGLVIAIIGCDGKPDPIIDTHWDFAPSWSNAGDKITFTRPGIEDSIFAEVLYLIDTTGTEMTPLTIGGMHATWLPGDTEIVYFKGDFKIYYMNLNTMQESLLCDCIDSRFPDVDNMGDYIYYENQGVSDNWATSIYKMDLATGDTSHIVGGSIPRLSTDNDFFVFYRHDSVLKYDLNNKSTTKIFTPGNQSMSDWSPDDDEILIGNIIYKENYGKIYKVNPNGSNAGYFTNGIYPHYSPNGDRILVVRPSADDKDHLWLIDREGKNPKQITF